ncbi:MAG: acireductone synthase [Phycisphaera sp.]|nr:acireductone synthase [Phycisphaera sp.]
MSRHVVRFDGRAILVDIEGTTSSIRYVYDEMFPYVRQRLRQFLAERFDTPETHAACETLARDVGHASLDAWARVAEVNDDRAGRIAMVARRVLRLMDADTKATGLKALQGQIWESGFVSGELIAHVYPDVPVALRRWAAAGLDLRVYSSGSIAAQKLFFGHTEHGDLLGLFSGHYDTTTGPKKSPESYDAIADDWTLPATDILFISDVVEELDAARTAGMATALSDRPGNHPAPAGHSHPVITGFDQISPCSLV